MEIRDINQISFCYLHISTLTYKPIYIPNTPPQIHNI